MKVLHLNTERTWRGGEKQCLRLAAGLRDRGEESEVVAQPGSPMAERARAEGLVVHEVPMRGEWDLGAVRAIRRLYRGRAPDVAHMHTSHAHTLGCLARVEFRQAPEPAPDAGGRPAHQQHGRIMPCHQHDGVTARPLGAAPPGRG